MDKPLVSICIPTRNTQRWVRQAIDSALEQTWGNREVIVIDDGSTDETPAILKSYGNLITWRSTPPQGGNPARNLAISMARGEWIQFLDADDYLLQNKIESQFNEVGVGNKLDLIWSPELIQRWAGKVPLEPEIKPRPTGRDWFDQWFRWELPGTQGGLWRKDALSRIGNWNVEMPCCQDYELYARALQHGLTMQWTYRPASVYRIWSQDTVCRRNPVQLIQMKTMLIDRMAAFLKERGLWRDYHAESAGRTCFEMSRTLAQFSPEDAAVYHKSRLQRDMIRLSGPAARWAYRMAYGVVGFKTSEQIARLLR